MAIPTKDEVQAAIDTYIASLEQPLRALNKQVRSEKWEDPPVTDGNF